MLEVVDDTWIQFAISILCVCLFKDIVHKESWNRTNPWSPVSFIAILGFWASRVKRKKIMF